MTDGEDEGYEDGEGDEIDDEWDEYNNKRFTFKLWGAVGGSYEARYCVQQMAAPAVGFGDDAEMQ